MEILVQARKYGYKVLYPETINNKAFYGFATDVQSANAENKQHYYGKSIYSIAFAYQNGCIFTKYIIGYDVQRGAVGNIGISIHIPQNRKLSGRDIKELLDKLCDTYVSNYCPDYHIKDHHENWTLFTSIANEYDSKIRPTSSETFISGSNEPAFIYYESDEQMCRYFEKPYQKEYEPYQQIFFTNVNNKDKDGNPLKLFKNSNLELTGIDLNDYYKPSFNSIPNLTVLVNDKLFKSDKKLLDSDKISIYYTPDEACYEQKEIEGTLNDPDSEIMKYLKLDGYNVSINTESLKKCDFVPKTKQIFFEVNDFDGIPLKNAEISFNSGIKYEPVKNGVCIHTFTGYEIKERHIVMVRYADKKTTDKKTVCPNEQDKNTPVRFILQNNSVKVKETNTTVVKPNDKQNATNKKQETQFGTTGYGTTGYGSTGYGSTGTNSGTSGSVNTGGNSGNTIGGGGHENPKKIWTINKSVIIIAAAVFLLAGIGCGLVFWINNNNFDKYQNAISECLEGDSFSIKDFENLKSTYKKRLYKDTTCYNKIKKAINIRENINENNFSQASKLIKEFKESGLNNTHLDSICDIYNNSNDKNFTKKLNNRDLTLVEIKDQMKFYILYGEIESYVSGMELLPKRLNELEDDLSKFNPDKNKMMTEYNINSNYNDLSQKIENAKNIRSYIKNKELKELKELIQNNQVVLYDSQQDFKNQLNKVDNNNVAAEIKTNDLDEKPLSEVTKIINNALKKGSGGNSSQNNTAKKDEFKEIKEYIKGDELNVEILNGYLKTSNLPNDLKNCINLCIRFWDLDGKTVGTFFGSNNGVFSYNNLYEKIKPNDYSSNDYSKYFKNSLLLKAVKELKNSKNYSLTYKKEILSKYKNQQNESN